MILPAPISTKGECFRMTSSAASVGTLQALAARMDTASCCIVLQSCTPRALHWVEMGLDREASKRVQRGVVWGEGKARVWKGSG